MSHKTLVKIAIAILVIFGITIIVFPTLYGPDDQGQALEEPAASPTDN